VALENELRGLLKVFGIRLASRVAHGAFDATLHPLIKNDPMLARALLPMAVARKRAVILHVIVGVGPT
jgi:transposase